MQGVMKILNKLWYLLKYFCSILSIIAYKSTLVIPHNKSKYKYRDLAPNEQINDKTEYFSALDWAFNERNIFNIAIAGPYGSGKSSIIQSYIRNHPELRYVNISLANFAEISEREGDNTYELIDCEEDKLEVGFLKQLFYRVKYQKIPQSRYRKLHTISKRKIVFIVIIFSILTLISSTFLIPNMQLQLDGFISKAMNNLNVKEPIAYRIGFIMLSCFIMLFSFVLWFLLSRVRVKEINLADKGTAEFDKTEENSVFNRNLDEIVYFFEATKYNIVFIEDLDRFKNSKIFVKLRELNTILNNYEAIRKKIVFVYAIRDDIFSSEDRTKFFEFILPVIPIMNETNSGECLLKRMKDDLWEQNSVNLTEDYVTLIAPYINEMRILNNICNEFITYKVTLQKTQRLDLKDEMMFSILTFKNLYPKDFADLQAEKGLVKEAFQRKNIFIKEEKEKLETEKQRLLNQIESLDLEVLEDIKELKIAMLFHMTGNNGYFEYLQIRGDRFDYDTIMNDNFDMELLRTNGTVYFRNLDFRYHNTCEFDAKSDFVGSKDYIKRYQNILLKLPQKKEYYQNKIEEINLKISELESATLKILLETNELERVLPEYICTNKLLVFLLRKGFIDETYPNYINFFHANSITSMDMNFILSVRNQEALQFNYSLFESRQVIKRLLPYEFKQKEILNFDLMDQILSGEEEKKCQILFQQLSDEDEKSWKFIDEYFERYQKLDIFTRLLCKNWTGFWDFIFNNQLLSDDRKEKYFISICRYAEIEDIRHLNQQGNIKVYFEEHDNVLGYFNLNDIDRIQKIIQDCNIRFFSLDIEIIEKLLYEWIFDKGYYQNALSIFQSIFKWKMPEAMSKLLIRNYSTLLELDYKPLLEHLNENFEQYVKDIVLKIETNTEETLDAVLEIIEKEEDITDILQLIKKENVILDCLDRCLFKQNEDKRILLSIWNEWISCNKLEPEWKNLQVYWHYFGVTEQFLKYLDKNIDGILIKQCPENWDSALTKEVMLSEIEVSCFEKFIHAVPKIEDTIDLSKVSEKYLCVLIENKYFDFTDGLAEEIRMLHPYLYPLLLIVNKEYVMEEWEQYEISMNDLEMIVKNERLNDNEKIFFIEKYATNMYSKDIALFLRGTKTYISKTMFQNVWVVLNESERYELFLNQISIFSKDEISNYLMQLGTEYQKFSDRSRRHDEKLYDTEYNRKLVEYLKEIGYISSYISKQELDNSIADQGRNIQILICKIRKGN